VNGFINRLVQRSRSEAVVAEPYRTPLLMVNPVSSNGVSDPQAMDQHPTADNAFPAQHFQDRPQAESINSETATSKPDSLSSWVETLNSRLSAVKTSVIQNDIPTITAKLDINARPNFGDNTQSPRLQQANSYTAQPKSIKRNEFVLNENHEYSPLAVKSQRPESIKQALPLPRFYNVPLENTSKPKKHPQQPAQQIFHGVNAPIINKAAVAAMPESQTIDVHVHIGRIDIRAANNSRQPVQNTAPKTQASMGLNDYIEQRTRGRR